MHAQIADIVHESRPSRPRASTSTRCTRARDLLQWLAEEHFTFLGYREYHLDREDGEECLHAVPGTGLGILRADPDMSRGEGCRRPRPPRRGRRRSRADEGELPVDRAPPGVPRLRRRQEVRERRGRRRAPVPPGSTERGLHRVVTRDPAAAGPRRAGPHDRVRAQQPRRQGADGRPETYPRDDFPHDRRRAAPMAEQAMHAWERHSCGCSSVATPTAATSRCSSTCRATARPPRSASASCRSSRSSWADSAEFTVRLTESTTARVHFVVHPPKGCGDPRGRRRRLERRLAEASRSCSTPPAPSSGSTARQTGAGSRGATSTRSWRPTREDFIPRIRGGRPGRLEALAAGESGGIDLVASRGPDAGRGEARPKVSLVGSPLSLCPRCCRCCRRWASRSSTRRPLPARRAGPADLHLRVPGCATGGHCARRLARCSGCDPAHLGRPQRDRRLPTPTVLGATA